MSDKGQLERWARLSLAADIAESKEHGFTRVPSRTILVKALIKARREFCSKCGAHIPPRVGEGTCKEGCVK